MDYPASVYAAARVKYVADYPRVPFGNTVVPDFNDYLAREYAIWYDRNLLTDLIRSYISPYLAILR